MTQPGPPPDAAATFDDLTRGSPRPLDVYLQDSAPPPRPRQASDPTVLTDGRVVPREPTAPAGSGSFTVDLEHAPHAIRELQDALVQLQNLRDEAVALGNIVAPSPDQVSRDAAAMLGAVATGGGGSLVAALEAGITRMEALIRGLQADLDAYTASDDQSARVVTRSYRA